VFKSFGSGIKQGFRKIGEALQVIDHKKPEEQPKEEA
jgi:hypothetical protein